MFCTHEFLHLFIHLSIWEQNQSFGIFSYKTAFFKKLIYLRRHQEPPSPHRDLISHSQWVLRPGLIYLLRYLLYYLAIVIKAVTLEEYKTRSYNRDIRVHLFRAASAGTKSSVLVLFGYAQTTLNADATFEFHPHECDKGLLPTILL